MPIPAPKPAPNAAPITAEHARLLEHRAGKVNWKRWGTYVAERAWGTVREDYSADGDSWRYFPHEHARLRAYRWNEDGIGGFCDEKQNLCLALAFWNERDPILKERLFGLTNPQGNHGEDVKEYYFFLDGTPTHSYMKMVYKYPQATYPYEELVAVNQQRSQLQGEFELFDALQETFEANRYFDIFIEYAKANPEDVLCRVTAINRGPDPAPLHILPHLWYRNRWSWTVGAQRPAIQVIGSAAACANAPNVGPRWWYLRASDAQPVSLLFTENETNFQRLNGAENQSPFVKDGIHDAVVHGLAERVNPQRGSKVAGQAHAQIAAGGSFTVEIRFTAEPFAEPFADFDAVFAARQAEADQFHAAIQPPNLDDEELRIVRQGFAGLLWSKQYYHYDVFTWLKGDETRPTPPPERWRGRNATWKALHNSDVVLMPDTWEYPWYASWDLAFHCVAVARIDVDLAKEQLLRMGYEWYQHVNGQVPAYEWNFDDVNPPVIGWAAWRVYQIEMEQCGAGDLSFLKEVFQSEMLNFSFWVNRKDSAGRDVFGGGFLGMDNIGCFDRDTPLQDGNILEQSDGTSWMALYCATMLSIATELARHEPFYQNMAVKYFEHFLYIAHAMTNMDGAGIHLWDAQDQFFYDAILHSTGEVFPLRLRSMVGLVPLFAVRAAPPVKSEGTDLFAERADWFLDHRPDLLKNVAPVGIPGQDGTKLLAIFSLERLQAVLKRMLDPAEFLSDFGIRALSRYHLDHPFVFDACGEELTVKYLPGESDSRLFGGNSNWRGPIWFPVNYMIVHSLHEFYRYYGDAVKVECPTGSGQMCTLLEVAQELVCRLNKLFLPDPQRGGFRPAVGPHDYFQTDPQWRDYLPFYEYFHGDSGLGLGASHQTGWTALIVSLLYEFGGRASPRAEKKL
ncbi:MAG TPA: glucosidase [Pirellulales bacterium]|nr:glucosidase [Pirellulales bacterium]